MEQRIIDWADEKGILSGSTEERQAIKTLQELGELAEAFEVNDVEAIKMELGDVWVTLIIRRFFETQGAEDGVLSLGFSEETWLSKNVADDLLWFASASMGLSLRPSHFKYANDFCAHYPFTLTDAVEAAYNKISKRTGKMVNGMFVKEES